MKRDRHGSATWAWIVYDLANTIFALGVVGLYFPEWLTTEDLADSTLALTVSAAGVVVVFLAPWIGAVTDLRGGRVRVLASTTLVAVTATALLTRGPDLLTFALLGVALVAVNTGSVVYDALLPLVSTPANRGRVSGLGVGVGYVGSFIGLGIGVLSLAVFQLSYASTFLMLGTAFLVFALPAFVAIREPPSARAGRPPRLAGVAGGLVTSWRSAARWPGVVRFLLSRFLYTDAINTLIGGFLTIFAIEEIGLQPSGSRTLLGLAIAFAILGGIGGGRLVETAGARSVLRLALLGWIAAILIGVGAAVTGQTWPAWVVGPLGGVALGATWTSDRVLMLEISPPEHIGEFYGLYATVGRFATILGPLAWAFVVDALDLGRNWAMVMLAGFIAAGWVAVGSVGSVSSRPRVTPAG